MVPGHADGAGLAQTPVILPRAKGEVPLLSRIGGLIQNSGTHPLATFDLCRVHGMIAGAAHLVHHSSKTS